MKHPKTPEDDEVIDHLYNNCGDDLTAWEVEFLESIAEQDWLSERQLEILDEIWERVGG